MHDRMKIYATGPHRIAPTTKPITAAVVDLFGESNLRLIVGAGTGAWRPQTTQQNS
jgi:hypothetical protein